MTQDPRPVINFDEVEVKVAILIDERNDLESRRTTLETQLGLLKTEHKQVSKRIKEIDALLQPKIPEPKGFFDD